MTHRSAIHAPQEQASTEADGWLVVDCSHSWLNVELAFTGPSIEVEDRVIRTSWGQTVVPLPPGRHHVAVSTRFLGRHGHASTRVTIEAGRETTVHYRSAALRGSDGMIGSGPQRTNGIEVLAVIAVVTLIGWGAIIKALLA